MTCIDWTISTTATRAAYAATHTGAILAAAERYFGMPYPFPKLDLIAFPSSPFFGAMENPGLITYTARNLLARFKVPKRVVFEALPKTSTGKIQKFVLRARAKSAAAID